MLAPLEVTLHHIGSTAVPGLLAKPVIDMLMVVGSIATLDANAAALERLGYQAKGENGVTGRRYFVQRGEDGARRFHLHAFAEGAPQIAAHLAFRDRLRANPALADDYAMLKGAILADGAPTRADYEAAKAGFITRVIALP
ncbi:MAG: GrpB family protein [Erythrobacter sp.]|nr:MAG: GrpB family protein [Erythrobacter sp.]